MTLLVGVQVSMLIQVPRATTQNKDVDLAKLLPEAMSGFIAQLQPVSALNSVTQVDTRAIQRP